MAKKSFNQRNPAFKWIFLLAIAVSIPLTLFSINHASTETRSHAATYTCSSTNHNGTCPINQVCQYDSAIAEYVCVAAATPTPALSVCSIGPTWSGILGHTDGATSVTYHLKLTGNFCSPNGSKYKLSATVPAGWGYAFKGNPANTPSYQTIVYDYECCYINNHVYVTISRPKNAVHKTYTIHLKATAVPDIEEYTVTSSAYSTKSLSYIVN